MKDYLVSVIIPIYNVEAYLRKCVDSILNQTYSNLEVILVDDGSSDGCPAICDEYKEKDSRIKVIHKPNGGLADARNAGLDAMTGKYVTFVDSDDYLAEDAIEIELLGIKKSKCKISCINTVIVSSDYQEIEKKRSTKKTKKIASKRLLKQICNKKASTSICNKLFCADVIGDKRFRKGRLNEDFLFLATLLLDNSNIAVTKYNGYFYYTRPNSITHNLSDRSLYDSLKNIENVIKENPEKSKKHLRHLVRLLLYQVRTLLIVLPEEKISDDSETFVYIKTLLRKYSNYIALSSLKVSDKAILMCACINPTKTSRLLHKLRNMKHEQK